MEENYYALLVCIIRPQPVTVEQSFMLLEGKKIKVQEKNKNVTNYDTLQMIILRNQGKTYEEIGKKYNLSKNAAMLRIRRLLKEVDY